MYFPDRDKEHCLNDLTEQKTGVGLRTGAFLLLEIIEGGYFSK